MQLKMDIELLRTFLEVKHTRHFGKAADNLYITQAAVSARIKQLESILGANLFFRHRNNLQLTATGERLIIHAETMLIAWERTKQDVALCAPRKPSFSLATTHNLWTVFIQPNLSVFSEHFTDVACRLEAHNQDVLLRRLLERSLDLALAYEPPKQSELSFKPAYPLELILVSSVPDIVAEQVFNQPYIYIDWGAAFNLAHARLYGNIPAPDFHTNMASVALDWLCSQHASCYLPRQLVQPLLRSTLFPVEKAEVIHKQVYWVFHTETDKQPLIEQFMKAFR